MTGSPGGELLPEPDAEYYMALVRGLEDRSGLAVPLHENSKGGMAIIDGDIPGGWWVSTIYAVDVEEEIFVVTTRDDQPFYDFVGPSRIWDHAAVIDRAAKLEAEQQERALEEFIEAIEGPNPN